MDSVSSEHIAETARKERVPPSRGKVAFRFVLMALVLTLVGGGLYGFDQFRKGMIAKFFAGNVPPPAAVSAEVAVSEAMPRMLDGIGTVAAVHQVTVAPEVGGRVTAIFFEAGATVSAGAPLVQLNDGPDRADLAADHAQATFAQLTLDRSKTLAAKKFGTQEAVDQGQSQLDAAKAAIARAEAVIAQKLVRAPFAGQLGVRQVEVGQYLAAGTAVVTLTDLEQLYVNFTLPEQARSVLSVGQSVQFKADAFADRTFSATVSTVEPQVDSGTRTIKVQASLRNPGHLLLPGMFAKVQVVLPSQSNVVTIPETAVDYTAYGELVYLVRDAGADAKGQPSLKAVQSFVKTGSHHDGKVAILEGVVAGDRVVSAGQVKLHNGAAVVLANDTALIKPTVTPLN
jgi:multidrug efflux system membrane fusion protein